MKRGPPLRVVLGRAGLLTFMLGTALFYWKHVQFGMMRIGDGKMYLSGDMPPDDLQETVGRLGIRSVIDLRFRSAHTETERAALKPLGVKYYSLPTKQFPSVKTVDAYLKLLDDPASYPVLVHCRHGSGRARLFGALYRIEFEGWSPDKARRATRFLPETGSFAKDESKGIFLRNYTPRRIGPGRKGPRRDK